MGIGAGFLSSRRRAGAGHVHAGALPLQWNLTCGAGRWFFPAPAPAAGGRLNALTACRAHAKEACSTGPTVCTGCGPALLHAEAAGPEEHVLQVVGLDEFEGVLVADPVREELLGAAVHHQQNIV